MTGDVDDPCLKGGCGILPKVADGEEQLGDSSEDAVDSRGMDGHGTGLGRVLRLVFVSRSESSRGRLASAVSDLLASAWPDQYGAVNMKRLDRPLLVPGCLDLKSSRYSMYSRYFLVFLYLDISDVYCSFSAVAWAS